MFRAYEPNRDRLVAIKVFRLDLTPEQSTALVGHFDALIAANINHPNIAAPLAAGLDGGAVYLAQEYVVGDSLDVVLRGRAPMSIRDAEPIVESLAGAIAFAASRGVQHGSLHLRDIIVAADAARITGFGIAAALTKISAKLPTRPQYSSPAGPSDAYSLGAIAFEMVSGKRASPDNVKDFEAAHADELHGALGVALRALETTGATNVAAVAPSGAKVDATELSDADLDLRIDPPVELMPEPEDDPLDTFKPPASEVTQGPAAWSVQPPDDLVMPEQNRRWPIVAIVVGFAIVAALSVGYLLRKPTPVATREPKAVVDETTVDIPANAPKPAPAPEVRPALPSPTPSRPASGAVAAKPSRGSLLIRSSPADAEVLLNGRARGKTPLTLRDLDLGSYTIRVVRDGYVAEERKLQLTTRRPTASATFNLRETPAFRGAAGAAARAGEPGGINVRSRPEGARVFVNDRLVGSTPIAIPGLPAGPATVRIEMDGYETWITTIQIGAGEQARVAASLERK